MDSYMDGILPGSGPLHEGERFLDELYHLEMDSPDLDGHAGGFGGRANPSA
ncbi:MAG: hypothetical protein ACLR23_15050 [Clostridia bacterium]